MPIGPIDPVASRPTPIAHSRSSAPARDRKTALDMARLMVTQYLGQQPHS